MTMISFIKIVALCLISIGSTHAFTSGTSLSFNAISRIPLRTSVPSPRATSMSNDSSESNDAIANANANANANVQSEDATWEAQLGSKEIQEVRKELVLKYTSLGSSPEKAEKEVDEFLNDQERCEQYLDMRRYAQAQADDLSVNFGQIGLAFFIGLAGTIGPKLLHPN